METFRIKDNTDQSGELVLHYSTEQESEKTPKDVTIRLTKLCDVANATLLVTVSSGVDSWTGSAPAVNLCPSCVPVVDSCPNIDATKVELQPVLPTTPSSKAKSFQLECTLTLPHKPFSIVDGDLYLYFDDEYSPTRLEHRLLARVSAFLDKELL